jgi:hypothetical protein
MLFFIFIFKSNSGFNWVNQVQVHPPSWLGNTELTLIIFTLKINSVQRLSQHVIVLTHQAWLNKILKFFVVVRALLEN